MSNVVIRNQHRYGCCWYFCSREGVPVERAQRRLIQVLHVLRVYVKQVTHRFRRGEAPQLDLAADFAVLAVQRSLVTDDAHHHQAVEVRAKESQRQHVDCSTEQRGVEMSAVRVVVFAYTKVDIATCFFTGAAALPATRYPVDSPRVKVFGRSQQKASLILSCKIAGGR